MYSFDIQLPFLTSFVYLSLARSIAGAICEINQVLQENSIFQDLQLPNDDEGCLSLLNVTFGNLTLDRPGKTVALVDVQDKPQLDFLLGDQQRQQMIKDYSMTLVMLDPDAPSRNNPIYRWVSEY